MIIQVTGGKNVPQTNQEIVANFYEKCIKNVKWWMSEESMSYPQAKAIVQKESCAGPALWNLVDSHFAQKA